MGIDGAARSVCWAWRRAAGAVARRRIPTGARSIAVTPPTDRRAIAVDANGARPGSIRMAVPAYFAPGPEWQRVIAAAPTVGMVIINPASGPGTSTDPQYTQVIAQARAAGIIVLGYVSTSYGQRPEADVIADINGYYDLYSLSGIYLAEGPMEADCTPLEAQYRRVADAAHARDAHAYLAVGHALLPDVRLSSSI